MSGFEYAVKTPKRFNQNFGQGLGKSEIIKPFKEKLDIKCFENLTTYKLYLPTKNLLLLYYSGIYAKVTMEMKKYLAKQSKKTWHDTSHTIPGRKML